MTKQLKDLATPFPKDYVKQKGQRGDSYVPHAIVKQRLLQVCGGYDFNVIREIYDGDTLTGVLAELRVEVDGKISVIQEFGDVEQHQSNNASNAKHAVSDAFKRCCAHIGLGLHLWAQEDYFLFKKLSVSDTENEAVDQATDPTMGGELVTDNIYTSASASVLNEDAEGDDLPYSDIRTDNDSIDPNDDVNSLQPSESPQASTNLDKRLEDIKKRKIDNPQQGRTEIDEKTGQKITYKYDK